ncbi:SAM-dependent methyltransferase [Streptomyces sp. NPDC088789]|uniref:SAM-dependent methyltransferase n=1 Tax=Streptomyces sp. NPDC088789 TaxID=3365899 RepID=UPI003801FDD9
MTTAHRPVRMDFEPDYFIRARAPRVYDGLLGGTDTFMCDREAILDLYLSAPWAGFAARTNRHFTQISTGVALRLGIGQFLDLGCGLPNRPHLHDFVPHGSRLVYVDRDPGVLAHAKFQLDPGKPWETTVVPADLLDMEDLLARKELAAAFDLERPIAVTVHDVLPWNEDDTAVADAMAVLRDWLPTGSTLSITHLTAHFNPSTMPQAVAAYARHGITVCPRSLGQVSAYFGNFAHLGTGPSALSQWSAHGPNVYHFTPYPARASDCAAFAAIAVKT